MTLQNKLVALKKSRFRSKFKLEKEDHLYLEDHGLPVIQSHAYDFIEKRLAPSEPRNDGKQTPFKGHPVFKAQHATATCCRGCLKKWHRIETGRTMTRSEIKFVAEIIMQWIQSQLAV